MSDEIKVTSDFTKTDAARKLFPTILDNWEASAFAQANEFALLGQKPSEAGSIVANMLIQIAWVVAGCGVATEGREPNKDKFRAAVEDALERIKFQPPSSEESAT